MCRAENYHWLMEPAFFCASSQDDSIYGFYRTLIGSVPEIILQENDTKNHLNVLHDAELGERFNCHGNALTYTEALGGKSRAVWLFSRARINGYEVLQICNHSIWECENGLLHEVTELGTVGDRNYIPNTLNNCPLSLGIFGFGSRIARQNFLRQLRQLTRKNRLAPTGEYIVSW